MTASPIERNRRVLIVGAKFGEVYCNAFLQPQPGLELAGILARGSRRARQLAHDFGVTLYTDYEQLPDDIDVACVVVRSTVADGEGSQVAAALLNRGIHVVQEHPLHPDDITRLQKLAKQKGLKYWINSFYPYVPAGLSWIDRAARVRRHLDGDAPCSAQMTTSRQLLYSTLDLLMQACGVAEIGETRIQVLDAVERNFVPISLALPGGCKALIRLQSYLDASDPDMHSLVMHQASLLWPAGYLTLESSYGPVMWTGVFHDSLHRDSERTLYRYSKAEAAYARPTSEILHAAPATWQDAFEIDGASGVARVLRKLRDVLDGALDQTSLDPQRQLMLARLWLEILRQVPLVIDRTLPRPKPMKWDELMAHPQEEGVKRA